MRAFFMLKETPDLDTLRGFIARCRQSDGGYAAKPGGAGRPGRRPTTPRSVLRWVRLLDGEPALVETAGFTPLFNGKDLDRLGGRHVALVGPRRHARRHVAGPEAQRLPGDRARATATSSSSSPFRLVGGKGNSGVQFRSVRIPGHEMSGYQADIGQNYWGCLYDESRRNKVLVQASPKALEAAATRPAGTTT